jgi:hypothetical protein
LRAKLVAAAFACCALIGAEKYVVFEVAHGKNRAKK